MKNINGGRLRKIWPPGWELACMPSDYEAKLSD